MSVTPMCPDHGAMQESSHKPGSHYCPKKGDGPKGYCRWKSDENGRRFQWPKDVGESKPIPRQSEREGGSSVTSVDANWLAALDFAALVYKGTGEANKALELASAARALLP